jgi:hypothetical protein
MLAAISARWPSSFSTKGIKPVEIEKNCFGEILTYSISATGVISSAP